MGNLNERTKQNFLIYANSVIKSRAIPRVEDNLKPIHRRILWSMYDSKFWPDKPTVKSAKVVGNVMGELHPHSDASIYDALVRLSQWWKLRYPLVELQGNGGNILGDPAASMRYTECRLTKLGMYMMEDINKGCVDTRPNFDNSTEEPVTVPSKFPFILCGNNSGIAVGMGSDLVSHNFTEVKGAIEYYLDNKDCSIADLMQFIKGPDFPMGGVILNGEELLDFYSRGTGSIKMASHHTITKKGRNTIITFHDLPYGVEIDNGIKKPLKKLVLEDGHEVFEDINVLRVGSRNFDISVTLGRDADVAKCLEILFAKTKLASSIKLNQNLIVDGEPRVLSLKEMIVRWVDYRSQCISRIAFADYAKTNKKLTITLGLQKCMSDIDKVIKLIRESNDRNSARNQLVVAFGLTIEQADAVLDMKLARLSKLDLEALNTEEKELEKTLAHLKNIMENESARYNIIKQDLAEIKKVIGEDSRLTEIHYAKPNAATKELVIKKEFIITSYGIDSSLDAKIIDPNIVDVVFAYTKENIFGYTKDGEMSQIDQGTDFIGALVPEEGKNKLVCVTKDGTVKASLVSDYSFKRANEKLLKLRDGDELVYAGLCSDKDFIVLYGGEDRVLKIPIINLRVAGKLTLGVKSGFDACTAATVVSDGDLLLFGAIDSKMKTLKCKYTFTNDFSNDSRGNKGQNINEGTVFMRKFDDAREFVYAVPKSGKVMAIPRKKFSTKSRIASGATASEREIIRLI